MDIQIEKYEFTDGKLTFFGKDKDGKDVVLLFPKTIIDSINFDIPSNKIEVSAIAVKN